MDWAVYPYESEYCKESDCDKNPLIEAIIKDSPEQVCYLLSSGVSPNFTCDFEDSPLYNCLTFNRLKVALILIKAGAEVNARDPNGRTVLFYAVENGDEKFVSLFLRHGADVNACDNVGMTPLHFAAQEGGPMEFCFNCLMDHGANINATSYMGKTPLHCAVESGKAENVKLVLRYLPNVKMKNYDNLFASLHVEIDSQEPMRVIDALLDFGFSVGNTLKKDRAFIDRAIRNGYNRLLRHIFEKGVDPSLKQVEFFPLIEACQANNFELVKFLIKFKVDSIQYKCAIDSAVCNNNKEILEFLLKSDIPRCMGDHIYVAVVHSCVSILEFLLDYERPQFNVNSLFREKYLPIRVTGKLWFGFLDMSNVQEVNKFGKGHKIRFIARTLAHIAADHNVAWAIETLINHGADLDVADDEGNTPLHYACRSGSTEALQVLLGAGADVNVVNKSMETPVDLLLNPASDEGQVMRRHIIALKAAGIHINRECEKYLIIAGDGADTDILPEYEREISLMKDTKVGNTFVSFYKVLTCSVNQLAGYAKNSEIMEALQSTESGKMFPLYHHLLSSQIKNGIKRLSLVDETMMNTISGIECFKQIPLHCIDRIMSFLSNEDLSIINQHFSPRVVMDD